MDLQLPMQSVSITTKVVSSNPTHGKVYSIKTLHDKFVSYLWQVSGFLRVQCTPISFTKETDRQVITEILLKVVLNTITLALIKSVLSLEK